MDKTKIVQNENHINSINDNSSTTEDFVLKISDESDCEDKVIKNSNAKFDNNQINSKMKENVKNKKLDQQLTISILTEMNDYQEECQKTNNGNPLDQCVNVSDMIYKLQYGKVVLERLPNSVIQNFTCATNDSIDANTSNSIKITPEYGSKMVSNNDIKNPRTTKICSNCGVKFQYLKPFLKHIDLCKKINLVKNKEFTESIETDIKFTTILDSSDTFSMIQKFCSICNKKNENDASNKLCSYCNKILSYQCKKCDQIYSLLKNIQFHLKSKCNPEKFFQCGECDFISPVQCTVQKHIRQNHAIDVNNKMNYNNTKLKRKRTSEAASDLVVKKAKLSTLETFNYKNVKISVFSNQMKSLNVIKRFCSKCNISVNTETKSCPNCNKLLRLQCLKCNKEFLNQKKIIRHLDTDCNTKMKFKCSKCTFTTTIKRLINKHCKDNHADSNIANHCKCTKCGKSYKNFLNLRLHSKVCGVEKYLKCKSCPYKTNYNISLKQHMLSKHSKSMRS